MISISVLIAAYNEESNIIRCIDSLLNQDFQGKYEIVIVDDGSTDNTRNLIKSIKTDKLVLIENPNNEGLVNSLNRGLEAAKGKYIARMDADDLALPLRLQIQYDYLESNQGVYLCGGGAIIHDNNGNITSTVELELNSKQIRTKMLSENCIIHGSVMFRKEILNIVGKYRNVPALEDYELWIRIINAGFNMVCIPEKMIVKVEDDNWNNRPLYRHWSKTEFYLTKIGIQIKLVNDINSFLNFIPSFFRTLLLVGSRIVTRK
jgi:glycosyltransferase involved in cell wall biosynthesis